MKQDPKRAERELYVGLENVRRMFRHTMVRHAQARGESLEELARRLRADPATHAVAARTACTVDQLLEGLGQEERLLVDPRYRPEAAQAALEPLVRRAAEARVGVNDAAWGDGFGAQDPGPPRGTLRAPHVEQLRRRPTGQVRSGGPAPREQGIRDDFKRRWQ